MLVSFIVVALGHNSEYLCYLYSKDNVEQWKKLFEGLLRPVDMSVFKEYVAEISEYISEAEVIMVVRNI